jgi:acyl-CoA synthetase (AMP-forming)/AMP-acid ligase II
VTALDAATFKCSFGKGCEGDCCRVARPPVYAEELGHIAANLERSGLETMDRVAVLLPNQPESVLIYLACFKAGYVVVPLDYRHQAPQLKYALNHCGASILIADQERLAELKQEGVTDGVSMAYVVGESAAAGESRFDDLRRATGSERLLPKIEPDQLCMMIYTSGTTSRPKGVTFTRGSIEVGIRKYLARVPMSAEDVMLIAAPIARPMTLRSQLLPILFVGGCARLLKRFEVNSYIAALRQGPTPTMLGLLPAAWAEVLRHPQISECDFRSLPHGGRQCVNSGSEGISADHRSGTYRTTGLVRSGAHCHQPPPSGARSPVRLDCRCTAYRSALSTLRGTTWRLDRLATSSYRATI